MHFEIYPKKTRRSDYPASVTHPKQYPCYELVHNDDWNDYGCYNWFSLWLLEEQASSPIYLGDLKIITTQEQSTIDALGTSFDGALDSSFCSLGVGTNYYNLIRQKLPKEEGEDLLRNLRDCVFTPTIREDFQNYSDFMNSLIRDQESEEALELGHLFLSGLTEDNAYRFIYKYRESYGLHRIIKFCANFKFRCHPYLRTIGIIGENGLGKTQMLSHLVKSLCSTDMADIEGNPLFKSCVALCSTPLDNYPEKIEPSCIPYYKYALEQRENGIVDKIASAIELITKKHPIRGKSIVEEYQKCLTDVIGDIAKNVIFTIDTKGKEELQHEVNKEEIKRIIPIMSSGQLHLYSLITYLFSQSHLSTLFILDEPEVHLHPHIMVLFMRVLARVLHLYNSYAIIATHSPLIVRELVKKNVQMMECVDGEVLLSPVVFDTFGEDVTTLYNKIFDYNEKDSYFYQIVNNMLQYMNYEEVVNFLSQDMELNLNAKLTIRDLAMKKDKLNA